MFCHQCQETAMNTGCSMKQGICGKKDEVANLQDLFIWVLKGISFWATKGSQIGIYDEDIASFVANGLFTTITNANFSKTDFLNYISKGLEHRDTLKKVVLDSWRSSYGSDFNSAIPECALWKADDSVVIEKKASAGTGGWLEIADENIRSLKALVLYGLKGMSAYLEHGFQIKRGGKELFLFIMQALSELVDESKSQDELIALVLKTGEMGVATMKYLDEANAHYGEQEITEVSTGVRDNPGILISGHDFVDLEELLNQSTNAGVDIYTHSEMLPAHYRPFFKKYNHLAGNYGNAWYLQKEEIEKFNGPVLFTSNCLVPPKVETNDRIFTTGPVGFEGCRHIPDRPRGGHKDFSPIINMAKSCKPPQEIENGKIIGGFGHGQVLALADKVVAAIKAGKIKRFIVMAGCDGRHKTRSYFTEVAKKLPKDTVILTAGCAKYKYNKLNLGDIDGIPRVLDAGQCNDSYSLAVVALELQKVFKANDINDLPISFDIAWYEQKAVLVLLALLSLGFKGIRIGPTLPGFLSPAVAGILVNAFNLKLISTPEDDIKDMMAGN
ncbi:MAG: hydroxylamine reductase [Candidatus Wallbacteria bacterium HGW-Wallbacteria-1]|jgi:hydroxylamine reductase|uniref:Hydroxylamine reductase n=1 Tax=Candidatus Wallbacteria bacterium HGW-Wallbacteria-1 TaxID=2013854 RepID=A0A2N1PLA4_9BACT|nr:MAG: hydroxylamine reductase [Candidatus Wallbacteria bacterium HGW-Wallbacteria-1]